MGKHLPETARAATPRLKAADEDGAASGRARRALLWPSALGVATILGAAPAHAQFGSPHLQRNPFSQRVAGNEERVIILPSVQASYDTNAFPYGVANGARGQKDRGDGRITPGIDVDINKLFGETRVTLSGSAGYDINTRFKSLNQPRISIGGTASVPVAGRCSVTASANYQQFRFNQTDVLQSNNATLRSQGYGLSGGCDRPVGFSPVGGINYQKQSSDDFRVFDYHSLTYNAGLAYTRPSLGTLTLTGSITETDRPAVRNLTGINDKTKVRQIGLNLARAVSPRLQFSAGAGFVKADPDRVGVKGFSGASYNGNVTYLVTPRFILTGSATRNIDNEPGISATYVKRDDYALSLSWRLTQPSAVTLSARRTYRNFRGEDILNPAQPINNDRVTQLQAFYSLDTLRRFRFTAGVSHLWRHGENAIYDYQSTQFTASLGARF